MERGMENALKIIYEDVAHEGSYGGVNKLYQAVKDLGYTKKQVKDWLLKDDNYSIYKPVNRNIPRPRVIVSAINQQWGADTLNMKRYHKYNKGFNYILVLIDVFTRFCWTVALQTLTGSEMKSALESVMKSEKPLKLRTDSGSEFKSWIVQDYLKSINVHHFFTTNEVKENFTERLNQTLRKKLERIFHKQKTNVWWKYLEAVTHSYNKTYHSTIKMSPVQAREKKDWVLLWKNQYEKKERLKKIKPPPKPSQAQTLYKFESGDRVRLSRFKSAFERAYDQKWSDEIYTIIMREMNQGIPQYQLKSWDNEIISGKFYEQQLQKVIVNESTYYTIEKTLKREKRKGVQGVWVKWEGWHKRFNSWIPEANIIDINES